LVFVFLPPLAALPEWLYFEARNPLNVDDPVVLVFLPIRGAILLVNAFRDGVVSGTLAGVSYGILVASWVSWRGDLAPWRRRMALGAGAGLIAGSTVVLATLIRATLQGRASAVPAVAIAFELVSGVVCGALAAPTAMRLLTRRPP
jgi:hypothetical protein